MLLVTLAAIALARVFDIRDCGAVADSLAHNQSNVAAITNCLANATAGDTVLVPAGKTFHAVGGIVGSSLKDITLRIDGTLAAVPDIDNWPVQGGSKFKDFIHCDACANVTITGTGGVIDGQGLVWWNRWVIGGIKGKHRPHLVVFENSIDLLVEKVTMLDSPNYHLLLKDVAQVEVRYITIEVNRKAIRAVKEMKRALRMQTQPSVADNPVLQPEDLNTDGIDPSGRDIWIHDCYINNDDDSIAVKPCKSKSCTMSDCSSNMLIENMVLSGFGASIGSVPADVVGPGETPNCVRNITFRNISMPETGKGVYIKSNPDCRHPNASAIIRDILYEEIRITKPRWWAIWIGPQQQHQPGSKLGQDCAIDYPISTECPTQACVDFRNITLRNVVIDQPILSPGVILGNTTNPMQVKFDGVIVNFDGIVPPFPYGKHYQCDGTHLTLAPNSRNSPEPKCSQ